MKSTKARRIWSGLIIIAILFVLIWAGSITTMLIMQPPTGVVDLRISLAKQQIVGLDIYNNILIIATGESLLAYTEEGEQLWEFKPDPMALEDGSIDEHRICAIDIADSGTIYIGTTNSLAYAVGLDGQLLWQLDTKAGKRSYLLPVSHPDGRVFLIGGLGDVSVVSATGESLLQTSIDGTFGPPGKPQWSSSRLLALVRVDNSEITCLDSYGDPAWNTNLAGQVYFVYNGPDGRFYTTSNQGVLYCLDDSGTIIWHTQLARAGYLPVVGPDEDVYASDDNQIQVFNSNGMPARSFGTIKDAYYGQILLNDNELFIERWHTDVSGLARLLQMISPSRSQLKSSVAVFSLEGNLKWIMSLKGLKASFIQPVADENGNYYLPCNNGNFEYYILKVHGPVEH